jgi:hypothetical protein
LIACQVHKERLAQAAGLGGEGSCVGSRVPEAHSSVQLSSSVFCHSSFTPGELQPLLLVVTLDPELLSQSAQSIWVWGPLQPPCAKRAFSEGNAEWAKEL